MRGVRAVLAVVMVAAGLVLAAPAPVGAVEAGSAVLVAGSTRPPAGDLAVRDLLVDAGFDLTIVDDDSDLAGLDLSQLDLLVISTSVSAAEVGTVFTDAPVPIVTWEPYLFDDLAISSSRETGSSYTSITVVDAAHPIAAGTGPGPVRVHEVAKPLSFGSPGPDASVIAHVPDQPEQATVFAYDPGDALVDGATAPAARVGLFPTYDGARRLTPDGLAILGAAFAWAAGATAPVNGPVNDDFADRLVLDDTATGTNVDATFEPDEQLAGSYFDIASASVWWTWTAPADGLASFSTSGSDFDTILGLWVGDELASLEIAGLNDDEVIGGATSLVQIEVAAGETYQVAVYGNDAAVAPSRGAIVLSVDLEPVTRPSNDDFDDAATLVDSATGTNVAATFEADEPVPDEVVPVSGSVWWNWTAPASGEVAVTTAGSNFDTVLAVWTGDGLAGLVLVGFNDDPIEIDEALYSELTFDAVAGETYRVAVYGYAAIRGSIELTATQVAAPANDDFADRLPLGAGATSTNVGATLEPGEPLPAVGAPEASTWWTWTAPATGTAVVSTSGSDFDTILAVWRGDSLATLDLVAENDDTGDLTSLVELEVNEGEVYQVAVYGFGGARGTIVVSAGVDGATSNDDFADRYPLPDRPTGTNVGATIEPGEPRFPSLEDNAETVWWTWTASEDGPVEVRTAGSDFDTIVAVWVGDSLSTLELVAVNDEADLSDLDDRTSAAGFDALAGEEYQIAVAGVEGSTGTIQLAVEPVVVDRPVNDDFADRLPLVGTATGTNVDASLERGERLGEVAVETSVWWTWTAPADGTARISTLGSDFDTILTVWSGDELAALEWVGANDDSFFEPGFHSVVELDVAAGETYQLAVSGWRGDEGSVVLSAEVEGSGALTAVLVAGSTRPPAGDVAIAELVRAAGYDLTIVDDDSDLGALDLAEVDLLLISTSVVPSKVGDTFAGAAVPIITWEGYLLDDLAMSSSGETSATHTTIRISDPSHPLAAGYDGSPRVTSTANRLTFGVPSTDADVVAHEPGRPDRAVVFAYETGDVLIDGSTAPAPRVALFPSYPGSRRLTAAGLDIIAAAIAWA